MKTKAAVLYEMGRAAPYARSCPLVIDDVTLEGPGPGEVLVEIAAAGLCHSDLSVLMGSSVPQRDLPRYMSLYRAGQLPVDELLSRTISLEEINSAMDALDSGQVVRQVVTFGHNQT
jgi:Zn-dependent alcohol dehydrogenase